MHWDPSRALRITLRSVVFAAILLGLLLGGASMQTVQAASTGTISGTVKDATSNLPITDFSIAVIAQNGTGATVRTTCSNPATGQYTLAQIPLGTAVRIVADGAASVASVAGCPGSSYSFEYWQHSLTFGAATPITLTTLKPNRTGINFTLGEAVPPIEYLIFNMDHTTIDELAVRQAIAYGMNRQLLHDTVRGPAGEYGLPPDSYVASNAWGAATTSTSPAVTSYPFDPAQARTILDNAGWVVPPASPDGIRYKDGTTRLSLTYKTTTAQYRLDTGALLVQEMQDIGIEIIPTYIDAGTFFGPTSPVATGNFDLAEYTTGFCNSSQDKTCVPFPMFRTGLPDDDVWGPRYDNASANSEYDAALASANDTDRQLHDLTHQQIVMNELPVLPLYTRNTGAIAGVIKKLDGTPLTGLSIEVDAQDSTTGDQVATTCTNAANGYYTLTGIPGGTSVAIYATGGTGCSSNSSFYGWSYWNESGDVTNLEQATPVLLTNAAPWTSGVNLSLGEAVPTVEYMVFNLDHANIDQSVRQAIAYGTNRLTILNGAWLPNGIYGTVENSYVADNHWAKAPDSSLHLYPYDPAQAAALLDADGWLLNPVSGYREKGGNTLSLTFKTTQLAARQAAGAMFVTQMQAIGIQIVPTYIDATTFFGNSGPMATRDFDIAEYAINYCRNVADEYCVPFAMYHNGDVNNAAHYNSAAAETAYADFQAATTHADRLTYAIAHQVIAMDDLPYLPLFTRTVPLTISGNAGVGGATITWTDGTVKHKTASSTGVYSITVPFDWSGTVTPSKSGRVFTPASRSYTRLISSKTAQNFTAKYIANYVSVATQDGTILESGELTNLGGKMDPAGTSFALGDDAQNKQYRAILSFNTAGLPDTAVIQSAVVKIEPTGTSNGTSPFTVLKNLTVDIRKPYFGTLAALQLTDFNAAASAPAVGTFGKVPAMGWYSATLNSTGRLNINKTGTTQLRLYFSLDDNNNHIADNMLFFSGNAASADRPVLTIIYTLP